MKQTAIKAAKAAGKILMKNFHSDRKISFKDQHEIVTKQDYNAEKEIVRVLKKEFPDHGILSEEGGGQKRESDYLWVVDPLDGTTNYSIKHPLFAVSISLFYKNEVVLGVVFTPYSNELFVAEKGKGAFLGQKRLKVSNRRSIKKSLLTFCHGHKLEDIRRVTKLYQKLKLTGYDLRQLGSASLELGFVADGRTESIVIPGAHSWDVAAGVLLVREAGGKVTDFRGLEWNLKSRDMVASNGKIHSGLLKIVKRF